MFENIGGKIKTLAWVIFIISAVGSVIYALVTAVSVAQAADGFAGLIAFLTILIVFLLVSWVGNFLLYGFGELIESTQDIRDSIRLLATTNSKSGSSSVSINTLECRHCGYRMDHTSTSCPNCGRRQ